MTGRLNDNSLDAWASRFIGKEKVSVNAEAGRSQVLLYGFDSARGHGLHARGCTGGDLVSGPGSGQFQKPPQGQHRVQPFRERVSWMAGNDRVPRERSLKVAAVGTQFFGAWKGQLDLDVQLDRYGLDTASQTSNQAVVAFEPSVSTRRGALLHVQDLAWPLTRTSPPGTALERPSTCTLGQRCR